MNSKKCSGQNNITKIDTKLSITIGINSKSCSGQKYISKVVMKFPGNTGMRGLTSGHTQQDQRSGQWVRHCAENIDLSQ